MRWHAEVDGSWLLEFYLPAGSYATTVLGEILTVGEMP
jgi:tRNA(Glu) U13 pseudouridine synthase TruD